MILTVINHGMNEGDTIIIDINNGFWKVFKYWILRKNLKRHNTHKVLWTTANTMGVTDEIIK